MTDDERQMTIAIPCSRTRTLSTFNCLLFYPLAERPPPPSPPNGIFWDTLRHFFDAEE